MTRLVFVTPAYGRVELARVCLTQRALLCDQLAAFGIDASCVVVADDENADTARELGFDVLEQDNRFLGRRFNDGIEWACREGGADFVCLTGSDDWILAAYFAELPDDFSILTGHHYAIVDERGAELACTWIDHVGLAGPLTIPRYLLGLRSFRPAHDHKLRGINGSVLNGIARRRRPRWLVNDADEFQLVGFKSPEVQMHTWSVLQREYGQGPTREPWTALADLYPADLVESAASTYARALTA